MNSEIICGDLIIHRNIYSVVREGVRIRFTPREFDLFEVLATHRNQVLSRQELENSLGMHGDSNSLDVLIGRVRKKIKGSRVEVKTVRSRGFTMHCEDPLISLRMEEVMKLNQSRA